MLTFFWGNTLRVHSHVQFIRHELLREPIVEQWVVLYKVGTFTLAIWSTFAYNEKFKNELCTHFSSLCGLKS